LPQMKQRIVAVKKPPVDRRDIRLP
jgi:hypothetical protein